MTVNVDIPCTPQAPARARRVVDELAADVDPNVRDDLLLLVSELVTNSVKHGEEGQVTLHVDARDPSRLRVEVVDQGSGFLPRPRERARAEAGGWGLHLVETLADRWGVHEDASRVWFEIDR